MGVLGKESSDAKIGKNTEEGAGIVKKLAIT